MRTRVLPSCEQRQPAAAAPAYVLGDVDLVTALAMAGVSSVVMTPPDDPARWSRHTVGWIPSADHWTQGEQLVERLLRAADRLAFRPALYVQSDGDLAVISRHRAVLAPAYGFVLADATLVEDLLDKGRFARLARQHGLPVPATVVVAPGLEHEPCDGLRLPVVVKPVSREGLRSMGIAAKALRVDDAQDLRERLQDARRRGVAVVVQELVAGPETAMESYHAYVDSNGVVVASFTGVKVRTRPRAFGHSSVLATSHAPDVDRAGRDVLRRLTATGVVKLDFKRDPQGRLWLLEVNPRFSLWQHLGAVAGVNLAAFVHADLTGGARPELRPARPGLVWCDPVRDLRGVLAGEVSAREWVRTVATCDARSGAVRGDVAPLLRGRLWNGLHRRLAGGPA